MEFKSRKTKATLHSIETVSGRFVDVSNPAPETISIDDIVWALSRIARFNGHTISNTIWSVGQHSLFVLSLINAVIDSEEVELRESLVTFVKMPFSIIMESISIPRLKLGALLHDAPEAYLTDLPTPVKSYPGIKEAFKKLEGELMSAIDNSLGLRDLTEMEHMTIKWADLLALRIEAANLTPSRGLNWGIASPPLTHFDVLRFPKVLKWKETASIFKETFRSCIDEHNASV